MRRALQIIIGLAVSIVGTAFMFLSLSGAINFFQKIILPLSSIVVNLIFGDVAAMAEGMQELSIIVTLVLENVLELFASPLYYIAALFVLGKILTMKGIDFILDYDEPITDSMEGIIFRNTDNTPPKSAPFR